MLARLLYALSLCLTILPSLTGQSEILPSLKPVGHVDCADLTESSGIAKSLRYKGVYWVHNDSGDTARIFAVDKAGKSVLPSGVALSDYHGVGVTGAQNVDWEDITTEGPNLIVSDMGNNKNRRRDLGVYVVAEPNPRSDRTTRALVHIPIAYPDQTEFPPQGEHRWDCEALFSLGGKLYFITKDRLNKLFPGNRATLYRLDTRDPNKINTLTKLDERQLDGWVTSASVSPDRKTLAVLTQMPSQSVWLFPISAKDGRFLSSKARKYSFTDAKQCEGICWDDPKTLIITNEQGDLYRVKAADAVPVPERN